MEQLWMPENMNKSQKSFRKAERLGIQQAFSK
jgi:hypothetical protein